MFAKLLELLLQAKAGAISGVFLLGATGALVSVSASNGVTTITLTDPSPTPTASASASPSATTSPTASPTASPTESPAPTASPSPSSSPAATTACADEAKAIALQVQRVDSAFADFHTQLVALKDTRDRATLAKADMTIKLVRHAAASAIHATATATCKKQDENVNDDENANEDQNDDSGQQGDNQGDHQDGALPPAVTTLSFTVESANVHDNDGKGNNTGITFTGSAESIATQAIAAMQTAFDLAKNAPAVTPKPATSHKPEASKKPDQKSGEHHD